MKTAYPNYYDENQAKPIYDLNKWMSAMRDIYYNIHLGKPKNQAVKDITSSWNKIEIRDFNDWLKYYEGSNHLKYKKAQNNYYVNESMPGYFIPNPIRQSAPEKNLQTEINEAQTHVNQISADEKRRVIEDHRKKLLGRLHSAEKLLSTHEGHIFAGKEFENLLNSIYELKRQIQTVNKTSIASSTYYDLIIRQANKLQSNGFIKSSTLLHKIAQNTPGNFDANQGPMPLGSEIDGAGTLSNTPPVAAIKPEESAIQSFLENLETSGLTDLNDIQEANDEDDVEIPSDEDDVILDQEILPDNNELFVEAQVMPVESAESLPEENMQMEPKEPVQPEPMPAENQNTPIEQNNFDSLIESAFSNVTVQDVIRKLEEVNNIFKKREVSRQLAIIDVMLNQLNLATFFPGLSEATNKALESNLYCLTRMEDIISRLKGSVDGTDLDLTPESSEVKDQSALKARQNLDVINKKEKERKDNRKKLQDKALDEKLKEPLEVENVAEEIAAEPTKVEAPIPAPQPVAPAKPV